MAYKSRVTNQYMGATFAGQVQSSNKSDVTDLVNILQKDVNPALAKIADQYVETKKDTAKEKINQLLLTKDSKTVQSEILNGQHPDLESAYVQKVVNFNLGRTAAAESIAEIEKNKSNYDFKTTNLPAFYKQYLPQFAEKDGSYALGFAAIFDKYKANDAIADAENRSKYAKETKLTNVLKVAGVSENAAEWWGTVKSHGDQKLPSGNYLSNDEQNESAILNANNVFNTAETTEEVDKALSILEHDRGIKEDGTKLGSLLDTKRKDVAEVYGKLKRKRVTLVRQEREDAEYEDKKARQDVFKEAMADNEDGTSKTWKQLSLLRDKLEARGDVSAVNVFDQLYQKNINSKINPEETSIFESEVRNGAYNSIDEVRQAMANRGLHPSLQEGMYKIFDTYLERQRKGLKPIHMSDPTYVAGIKQIQEAVLEGMKDKDGLYSAGNSKTAVANATRYIEKQIDIEEQEFKQKNNREMTWRERSALIEELTKRVVPAFKMTENPQLKSLNEYDKEDMARIKKADADKVKKEQIAKIENEKYGDVIDTVRRNIEKVKPPTLRKTIISGVISEATKENKITLPKISKYIESITGQKFDSEYFASITAETANFIIKESAKRLNITPKQMQEYLQTLLNQEYTESENLNK
jgi:hypothetical protein